MDSTQKRGYETLASNLLFLTILLGGINSFYDKTAFFANYGTSSAFVHGGLSVLLTWYLVNAFFTRKGIQWIKIFVLVSYFSNVGYVIAMNAMGKENFMPRPLRPCWHAKFAEKKPPAAAGPPRLAGRKNEPECGSFSTSGEFTKLISSAHFVNVES